MAGISHNVRRPQYRYLSMKRLRWASHSSLWRPSLAAILFNISGGSRWIRGGVPLPKWPRRPHGPINPQRRPLPLSSIQGFYDPGNSISGGRLLYFTVKRWATKYLTFVTWRHAEGAARAGAARKAITVTRSLSAQTSRDVFREHAGDAACWGSVGGNDLGLLFILPPLRRSDEATTPRRLWEAPGKWKSSITGGLRSLAQPRSHRPWSEMPQGVTETGN